MKKLSIGLVVLVLGGLAGWFYFNSDADAEPKPPQKLVDLESKLASISPRMGKPKSGDWLAQHEEPGQTLKQYLAADPVRKSAKLNTIYLCLIGDFTKDQTRIIDITREYLEATFSVPVKIRKKMALADIPDRARRKHPTWGDKQILSTYVLDEVLARDRPADALAYLAFTSSDLWPGEGWNFVFGQGSLRERTGVWSIYRNGDPSRDAASFQLCLSRTIKTAGHETGHILTMFHCTSHECNMNGSNNREESDRHPLHFCPVCLAKLCWNLDVEPESYLKKQEAFCRKHGLKDEADWYDKAIKLLNK